jgi:hypothetical protein
MTDISADVSANLKNKVPKPLAQKIMQSLSGASVDSPIASNRRTSMIGGALLLNGEIAAEMEQRRVCSRSSHTANRRSSCTTRRESSPPSTCYSSLLPSEPSTYFVVRRDEGSQRRA